MFAGGGCHEGTVVFPLLLVMKFSRQACRRSVGLSKLGTFQVSQHPPSFSLSLPFSLPPHSPSSISFLFYQTFTFPDESSVGFGITESTALAGVVGPGLDRCAESRIRDPKIQPLSHFLVSPIVSGRMQCLETQLYFRNANSPLYLAACCPLGIDNMLTES